MKKSPVVHFEMAYEDPKRASDFYSKVFGWEMNLLGSEMSNYLLAGTVDVDEKTQIAKEPGAINGGFYEKSQMSPSGQRVHVVISVDNLDESLKNAESNGAKIATKPMEIPGIGMYASIVDTEGNDVGVLQPAPMPTV